MTDGAACRVLIADDHPVVREGLAAVLAAAGGFAVVAAAADGEEAVQCYRELLPDVALLDLRMPRMGAIEAIAAIRRLDPDARLLVLTTFDGDEDIHRALAAGACGYLLKGVPRASLVDALRRAAGGRRVLPPAVSERLAARLPGMELTPREREVLARLAQGESNREIGERLGVAESTVRTFVLSLFGKLGVEDRTSAVVTALKRGLLHLDGFGDQDGNSR